MSEPYPEPKSREIRVADETYILVEESGSTLILDCEGEKMARVLASPISDEAAGNIVVGYRLGFERGKKAGRIDLQFEYRKLMGIAP
jgi:hypothetical protein